MSTENGFIYTKTLIFIPGIDVGKKRIETPLRKSKPPDPAAMLKHFILATYRSFVRNKSSLLINLTGLSAGLACVLLIYLWVSDELSVDKFHEKDDQLYTAMINIETPNKVMTLNGTPPLLGPALLEEMPEVEAATFTSNDFFGNDFSSSAGVLSQEDEQLHARGLFAGENFFQVLSYDLIEGSAEQVLAQKNNIVLSEELALKLFPSTTDAVGQSLFWKLASWGIEDVFVVSGVFKGPPENATKQFDTVIRFEWMIDADSNAGLWPGGYAETFLMLKDGTEIDRFNTKIADFLKAKHPARENTSLFVQRYSDRYLHGRYENGTIVGGRITYVRLFSAIALFILLIACVNFMNLSTARASVKKKEIGVKKTIGASRRSLILQFLGESSVMTFLSLGIAVSLVYALIPQFNTITEKQLSLDFTPGLLIAFIAIALITGVIAGSYPAFYLSGFSPQSVLKKGLPDSPGENWIRKGLVVFQFAIAVVFIVGVQVIHQQMRYTQERNLGYDRDNVVSFSRGALENAEDNDVFLAELKTIPGVINASNMAGTIQWGQDNQSGYSWRGQEADREISFKAPRIGYNVLETLNMEMLLGRPFSREFGDDESKIVINESALKLMGLEDPIGQTIQYGEEERQIIGVVRDFNYGSLHQHIEPLIFRFREFGPNFMVKIEAGSEQAVLNRVEQIYKLLFPADEFEFTFMDAAYQALYQAEYRVASLSKYFSMLAILISCLGLLGLTAFIVERRTKEIGIRKILGSSEWGIIYLLSQHVLGLVFTAILIALPISFWMARYWLDDFAYRIELSVWFFVAAAFLTVLIAWLATSVHTIRAAFANPTDCLRQE